MERECALLYVAASRARDVLVMSWAGEESSMLPYLEEIAMRAE